MASSPQSAPPPEPAGGPRIRLLIVDDSIVARTVLARILAPYPAFEIAGVAASAEQALDMLTHVRVDVVLLDVELPGMDGLTALPGILARSRGARVLIVSSSAEHGATATLKALALGAADTLLKPDAANLSARFAEILVERLLRLGAGPRPAAMPAALAPERETEPASGAPIQCLAIGASTGGVNALGDFFQALPDEFRAPILVTQHLPAVFIPYFARQLQDLTGRRTTVARDGSRLLPGELLVAPGDGHLRVTRGAAGARAAIDRAAAPSGCMPSVDPMLASLAAFGARGAGVVLSGMGRDGAIGAAALKAAGGEVLAQDAASSVVWGMPGAVANRGIASAVLPPDRLARRIGGRGGDTSWT